MTAARTGHQHRNGAGEASAEHVADRASEARANAGTKLQLRPPDRPTRFEKPRLSREDYIGKRTYHLTLVTPLRTPIFEDLTIGRRFEKILVNCAEKLQFSLLAYCFMPDHLHALVQGLKAESDLLRFVQRFKQETSFFFKNISGERPWQQSFFDRVLRNAEDPKTVARYISSNPAIEELPSGHPAYLLRGGELFAEDDLDVGTSEDWQCRDEASAPSGRWFGRS